MLTAEATIATDRPGRYLEQLCQHASNMTGAGGRPLQNHRDGDDGQVRHAEWTGDQGVIRTRWGDCTLAVRPDGLSLRAEAADAGDLRRLQDLITSRLERFGRREQLSVTWQPPGTVAELGTPRARWKVVLLVAVVVVVAATFILLHVTGAVGAKTHL